MRPEDATKHCPRCGRTFAWRRRWARTWDRVRYCSDRCRRARPARVDGALEHAIRELLAARRGTICPSEAARRVDPEGWRALLPRTRAAARRLAAGGEIVFLQGGRPVEPSRARGPVRLRLARTGAATPHAPAGPTSRLGPA